MINVLSLGVIPKDIEVLRRHSSDQCPAFENWSLHLQTDYASDILPITDQIGDAWGRLMAQRTLPVVDGLLAATALANSLAVVKRNTADFESTGKELVNPYRKFDQQG